MRPNAEVIIRNAVGLCEAVLRFDRDNTDVQAVARQALMDMANNAAAINEMMASMQRAVVDRINMTAPATPVVCPTCLAPLEGPFAGCVCGQSDDLGPPSPNGHKLRTKQRVEIHGKGEGYGHNGIVTGYFHNGVRDALAYSVELVTGPRRGRSLLIAEEDLKAE